MPITRTPIHDDSGGGTDGTVIDNAWKQELYNQIDALPASQMVDGLWAPVDLSGGGLTLQVFGSPQYTRIGRLVFVVAHFGYPATASGLEAVVTGLPFPNGAQYSGFYQVVGSQDHTFFINANATTFKIANPVNGVYLTNAQLSGQNFIMAGFYFTG